MSKKHAPSTSCTLMTSFGLKLNGRTPRILTRPAVQAQPHDPAALQASTSERPPDESPIVLQAACSTQARTACGRGGSCGPPPAAWSATICLTPATFLCT